MVKTFEMDPTSNIWLVLDLHKDVQAGVGDESTEEYAVRIGTSLAYHFVQANRMLGLMMFGAETVILEPARGSGQYGRILEALAVAQAGGSRPLSDVLQAEGRRFGRHTTAIVVTPSPEEDWVLSLQHLVQTGTRASAVLLEPGRFDSIKQAELPVDSLIAG